MYRMRSRRDGSKCTMFLLSLQLALILATMLSTWECGLCFPLVRAFVMEDHSRMSLKRCETRPFPIRLQRCFSSSRMKAVPPPRVWIEEAEEGFVDEEENLEPGEVCLRSVKSFASGVPAERLSGSSNNNEIRVDFEVREVNEHRRFLSAGALIQRYDCESEASNGNIPGICDAWMADSLLKEGGPNLQLPGALLVLDDLFLNHLMRERENYRSEVEHERIVSDNGNRTNNTIDQKKNRDDDSWAIRALRNFVVHCGDDDDGEVEEFVTDFEHRPWRSTSHVAASEMAAAMRGFVPLREMVRIDSIYNAGYYNGDTTGLVLDPLLALERYREGDIKPESASAQKIANLLPLEETLARYTTKRFTIPCRREEPL